MTFPRRQAAIAGVYRTKQGKLPDRTGFSLQLEAIKGAIAEAGMQLSDIDGLLTLPFSNHHDAQAGATDTHQFWAEQLGGHPIDYISVGGSAGQIAKAASAISSGLCEVAVLFYGRAGQFLGPRGTVSTGRAPRVPEWSWSVQGAYMVPFYALWAQRYMHEFGVTSEDLAEVAVIDRYHATLNPESVMGRKGEITVDDVVNSRMIAEPMHLLDCSLDNDGGYAVVVTTAERARDGAKKPVYVLGGAEAVHTDLYLTQDGDWFPEGGRSVRRAADRAFEQAGVTRDDIDYFGSYDCFTITAVRNYEEMGFCALGEGADFVKAGHTRLGGKLPTNTDGGLLSGSHCGDPSGLFVVETVRQLRGECGDRQVADAKIGLAHQQGYAVHGLSSSVILGVD
ncbi:thiolase family protein [Rhodococcus sp. SORGH_AS_0301]|uniref:thiolase family protein n=1 Tax=Rhodococcus sp. SORGH_AS_0301 TaxID=3041780 RepID=UPI0027874A88|nr:thiolase family protein [Rhodococcus sp. SORGH_AS_0301]MDQ1178575.1 acetyl-CoA acetyltransferase [Rhodococcus sp. SORGH_AS_0301]